MSVKKETKPSAPAQAHRLPALLGEVRRFIANAVLFNQHLADRLHINATDYQVLNLLDLRGSATPGALAQLTGLTTGGVTVVLDRLENAGFVRRERNPHDRRSVIIRTVPAKMREVSQLYKPIIAAMKQVVSAYDAREISTIVDFFERANRTRRSALDAPDPQSS
jgi:DNA-binding MarR family transcriptional regulator